MVANPLRLLGIFIQYTLQAKTPLPENPYRETLKKKQSEKEIHSIFASHEKQNCAFKDIEKMFLVAIIRSPLKGVRKQDPPKQN